MVDRGDPRMVMGGRREKREAGKWMERKKRVKKRSKYKVKKGK